MSQTSPTRPGPAARPGADPDAGVFDLSTWFVTAGQGTQVRPR